MEQSSPQNKTTKPEGAVTPGGPGLIQLVPLKRVRPTTYNPRLFIRPESIQAKKASLQALGQVTPAPVRPLTGDERSKFTPFEYLLIGGHVRLAGATLAGFETLKAVVLDGITSREAFKDALIDNRWTEMSWWRWSLAIEKCLKENQELSQRQLAAELGFSQAKIYNAVKITKVSCLCTKYLCGNGFS